MRAVFAVRFLLQRRGIRKVSAKFLFWRCFLEIIRKNRKKEGVGGQISIIFPVSGPILEIYGKNHAVRCL